MVEYVKISELPVAGSAAGTDMLEANQAGTTRRITVDQLLSVGGGPTDWADITGKPNFDALYVNVTGDTMTGDLKIGDPEGLAGVWLFKDGWVSSVGGAGWAGMDYVQRDAPADQRIWNTGAVGDGSYRIGAYSDAYVPQHEWIYHRDGSTTLPGALTGTTALFAGGSVVSTLTGTTVTPTVRALSVSDDAYAPPFLSMFRQGQTALAVPGGAALGGIRWEGFDSANGYAEFADISAALQGPNLPGGGKTDLVLGANVGGGVQEFIRVGGNSGTVALSKPLYGTTAHFDGAVDVTGTLNVIATTGYAAIEVGGPSGAYIDLKAPASDDYDIRILTDGTTAHWSGVPLAIDPPVTLYGALTGTTATMSTAIAVGSNDTTVATTKFVKDQGYATTTELGSYLPLVGGTLTGPGNLTVGGTLTAATVTAPAATTLVLNAPTTQSVSLRIANTGVVNVVAAAVNPNATGTIALGGTGLRWSGVYSVLGDFTGNIGTTGGINAATFLTVSAGNLTTTGGNLVVNRAGDASPAYLYIQADSAQPSIIAFSGQSNADKWRVYKDATAEAASNVGADFVIEARDNSGNFLSTPLFIKRSTGGVTLTGILTAPTITAPAATSLVLNAPTGQRVNQRINDVDIVQTQVNAMFPATTNAVALGGASNRWSGVYSVLGDFTGAITGTSATLSAAPAYPNNTTSVATTAYVTAALAAGASISVGTTPPGSPTANQLWWNSDASIGGGQLFIYFDSTWVPASPGVGSGAVVQTVSFQTGAVATGSTVIPFDDTIPQQTEGDQYMSLAITPRSATSKLVTEVIWTGCLSAANPLMVALFQDAAPDALAVTVATAPFAFGALCIPLRHVMVSGSTSTKTIKVRAGQNTTGTATMNGQSGTRFFGGVLASSIIIQEVL